MPGGQVTVSAQHGLGAYQLPGAVQHGAGEWVQRGGEEGPVGGGELGFLVVYLPLEDHDLVARGGDFGVFGVVAHGQ